MIKLLICDDSVLIRKILTDIALSDPEIQVVGEAKNGLECLNMIEKLKPNVVTMDIEMPKMTGLEALKRLNEIKNPTPVVMISSLTQEGAQQTIDALELGAVDFLPKPNNLFSLNQSEQKKEIIEKIKYCSKIKRRFSFSQPAVRTSTATAVSGRSVSRDNSKLPQKNTSFRNLVLIGSSTGGPKSLQSVIPKFPSSINAAVVIVQHMPAKFTKSLADRLNSLSELYVKEAQDGDVLYRGCVYVAPGDYHLRIKKEGDKLVCRLDQTEKWLNLRPTVDNMFDSAAKISGYKKIAVILTGMGSDGTKGLKILKPTGCKVIAQDEATSVVFGMPKAAIEAKLVDDVVSLYDVERTISKYMEV